MANHIPAFAEAPPEPPTEWLRRWLDDAKTSGELNPTAMALSSLSASGAPRTRFVLCKGVNDTGLRFFTNLESPKAMEMTEDNRASVAFHWSILRRQVRVEGTVELIDGAEADAYFATRNRLSNVGAWASNQSQPVASREALQAAVEEVSARYGDIIPRPPHWSGFHLTATAWEFWQDQPGRIHDRWTIQKVQGAWRMWRLQP